MAKNTIAKTWSMTTGADGRKYSEAADAPLGGGNAALSWQSPLRNGDTITITTDGTYNFGSKTNAKPMYYWDAGVENTLNSSPLSRKSFTVNNDSSPTLVTDVKPTNALASLRFSYDNASTAQGEIVQRSDGGDFITDVDGAGDHIIVMHRRRFSFSASEAYAQLTNWNQKLSRWWSAIGSNDLLIAIGQTSTSHGNFRISPELTDSTLYPSTLTTNDDFFGLNKGNWTSEILRVNLGTQDVSDSVVKWTCNGETLSHTFICKTASYPNNYRDFRFPQAQVMPNDQGWYAWVDYIYIDDTPHALLVSDAATWDETGTYRYEPFIPTAWSTSSITAVVRRGEFASLSGKYLYILGSDGLPIRNAGLAL